MVIIQRPVTYPYYVFGSQVDEGLNYFSTGPEVVEMVLRISGIS